MSPYVIPDEQSLCLITRFVAERRFLVVFCLTAISVSYSEITLPRELQMIRMKEIGWLFEG